MKRPRILTVDSILPDMRRGRRTDEQQTKYDEDERRFCNHILEIKSRIDFDVSARGWCYLLEQDGLDKGEFDKAERLINKCRKSGLLPVDICAEDDARAVDGLEELDGNPEAEVASWIKSMRDAPAKYLPISRWDSQKYYIEMAVEKIDLKSLFAPVCEQYSVPITNWSGWADINSRVAMMKRFAEHEAEGRIPVLLYCGDHDPGGLHSSKFIQR